MPIARLTRTRASLPEGYQFGDAGKPLPADVLKMIAVVTREFMQACGVPATLHRADTLDPDGYGHAV